MSQPPLSALDLLPKAVAGHTTHVSSTDGTPTLLASSLGSSPVTLGSMVTHLQRRVDLLDKTRLEAVHRRIKALLLDMDLLMQQKQKLEDAKGKDASVLQHEQRIRELYTAVIRCDEVCCRVCVKSVI